MDTPRPRPPRPPPLSRRTAATPAPPPPYLSAPTSPSHDFSFSFSSSAASPPFHGPLLPVSMSGTPVGRVGSDLSHHSHARTNHHQTTSYGTSNKDRDKNRASPFFSGLGAWRKQSSGGGCSDATGKPADEKRKQQDKQAKRGLDVAQWVKKHMAAMVEQLRASFSRQAETRERRRRPHSFSGHGPSPSAARERERWRRRRGELSSAPASLRVSPANSGHLSVGASVKVSTSSEESTMEELQSAIQAAIAHCKNSISTAKSDDGRRGDEKLQ